MTYCSKCGFAVDEKMAFCSNCGAKLTQVNNEKQTVFSRNGEIIKSRTILSNGVLIGIGVALGLFGLLSFLAFNSSYISLRDILLANGAPQKNIPILLGNIVNFISLSVTGILFGVYFLIIGLLSQFSHAARTAWNMKDIKARVGNGLMVGGFVFSVLSAENVVRQIYVPDPSGVSFLTLTIVGIIMWIAGVLLMLIPRKG